MPWEAGAGRSLSLMVAWSKSVCQEGQGNTEKLCSQNRKETLEAKETH